MKKIFMQFLIIFLCILFIFTIVTQAYSNNITLYNDEYNIYDSNMYTHDYNINNIDLNNNFEVEVALNQYNVKLGAYSQYAIEKNAINLSNSIDTTRNYLIYKQQGIIQPSDYQYNIRNDNYYESNIRHKTLYNNTEIYNLLIEYSNAVNLYNNRFIELGIKIPDDNYIIYWEAQNVYYDIPSMYEEYDKTIDEGYLNNIKCLTEETSLLIPKIPDINPILYDPSLTNETIISTENDIIYKTINNDINIDIVINIINENVCIDTNELLSDNYKYEENIEHLNNLIIYENIKLNNDNIIIDSVNQFDEQNQYNNVPNLLSGGNYCNIYYRNKDMYYVTVEISFINNNDINNYLALYDAAILEWRYIYGQGKPQAKSGTYIISGLHYGLPYIFQVGTYDWNSCTWKTDTLYESTSTITENLLSSNTTNIEFKFEQNDLSLISPANYSTWKNRIQISYNDIKSLVGDVPNNNNNQFTIQSTRNINYWGLPGYPIRINRIYVPDMFNRIQLRNDWSFGALHELGHNFIDYKYDFDSEFWANFLMYHTVEKNNATVYAGYTGYYTGKNGLKTYYEHDSAYSYNKTFTKHIYHNDGLLYLFIKIADQINNWQPFINTFTFFKALNNPPKNSIDKLNLFLTKLRDYSGKDVLSNFNTTDRNVINNKFGTLGYVNTIFTVSYNGNGQTSGTAPPNQTRIGWSSHTLHINTGGLIKTGYLLTGWNTNSDGTGTYYSLGATINDLPNSNIILYANWTPNINNVSYNGNNQTSGTVPANQTWLTGNYLTLRTNSGNLFKTGYLFNGWNTNASGTGTTFAPGATVNNLPIGNIILYARWTPVTNMVTYNGNNNTSGSTPQNQTWLTGNVITLQTNSGNLAKNGYYFDGWNTKPDGTGINYIAGQNNVNLGVVSLTLFARWSEAQIYQGGLPKSLVKPLKYIYTTSEEYANKYIKPAAMSWEGISSNVTISNISNHTVTVKTMNTYNLSIYGEMIPYMQIAPGIYQALDTVFDDYDLMTWSMCDVIGYTNQMTDFNDNEILSVFVHEFGHALSLDHVFSSTINAIMKPGRKSLTQPQQHDKNNLIAKWGY